MKKLVMSLLVLFSLSANAETGGYWSLGGSFIDFDDGEDTVSPKNVYGRLGYNFNDNIGIGFDLGTSLIEDDISGVDFSVDTTFFFIKAGVDLSETANIYVMFGPTNVELTASFSGASFSADEDDDGIGFGLEFDAGDSSNFHIEHITFFDKDGVEVTSLNLGYVGYFQ